LDYYAGTAVPHTNPSREEAEFTISAENRAGNALQETPLSAKDENRFAAATVGNASYND
jgi:hypothetical protein